MRAPLDEIEQTQRWNTAGQPPGLLTHPTHPIILPTPDMKRPSFTYTCAPAHYQSDYATTTAAASTAVSCKPHEPGTAAHLGVSSPPRLASYHVQAATGRPSQPEQQQTPPPPPPRASPLSGYPPLHPTHGEASFSMRTPPRRDSRLRAHQIWHQHPKFSSAEDPARLDRKTRLPTTACWVVSHTKTAALLLLTHTHTHTHTKVDDKDPGNHTCSEGIRSLDLHDF